MGEAIDLTLRALREHPEDWTVSKHEVENKKLGIVIWISNGHYGLSIKGAGPEIGGVTFFSTFFGFATPWRRRVMKAARKVGIAHMHEAYALHYGSAPRLDHTTQPVCQDGRGR